MSPRALMTQATQGGGLGELFAIHTSPGTPPQMPSPAGGRLCLTGLTLLLLSSHRSLRTGEADMGRERGGAPQVCRRGRDTCTNHLPRKRGEKKRMLAVREQAPPVRA